MLYNGCAVLYTSAAQRYPERFIFSNKTVDEWQKQRGLFISTQVAAQLNATHALRVKTRPAYDNRLDSFPLVSGDTIGRFVGPLELPANLQTAPLRTCPNGL